MPILLNRMPFSDSPSEIAVRGERVRIRANQIIVWVTLVRHRIDTPNPVAIPFPAILDTGHTHSFSIHEEQLIEWGGLQPGSLNSMGTIRDVRGPRVVLRGAHIWVHANERGSRETLTNQSPFPIKAELGIAIYPGNSFPRLPILGLRAIADNNLVLVVDGPNRQATLRTLRRWWLF